MNPNTLFVAILTDKINHLPDYEARHDDRTIHIIKFKTKPSWIEIHKSYKIDEETLKIRIDFKDLEPLYVEADDESFRDFFG